MKPRWILILLLWVSASSVIKSSRVKSRLKTRKAELDGLIAQIETGRLPEEPLLVRLDREFKGRQSLGRPGFLESEGGGSVKKDQLSDRFKELIAGDLDKKTNELKSSKKQIKAQVIDSGKSPNTRKSQETAIGGTKNDEANNKSLEDDDTEDSVDEADEKLLLSVSQIDKGNNLFNTETVKEYVIQEADIDNCNSMWSYNNRGNDWECMCHAGTNQSPINIDFEKRKGPWTPLKSNILLNFYDEINTPRNFEILNDGATVKLIGNFGRLVLPPSNMVYECEGIHFHSPAEHTINGIRYELEMHISFRISGRYEISKINNPFVTVSVFFKMDGNNDNVFLEHLDLKTLPVRRSESVTHENSLKFEYLFSPKYSNMSLVKQIEEANKKINAVSEEEVDIMSISFQEYDPNFPLVSFFLYHGSFTTPSCDESVTYILNENVYPISEKQLQILRNALFNGPQTSRSLKSNFRNIQARNNREIFYYNSKQNEMTKLFDGLLKLSEEDKCDLNKALVGIKTTKKDNKVVIVNDESKTTPLLEGDYKEIKQLKSYDENAKFLRNIDENTALKDIPSVNMDLTNI